VEIFSLVGKITLEGKAAVENALKEIDEKAKDVADQFNKVGSVFTTAGKKISNTGKNLSKYITAPLTGIGIAAGKMSIDFESAFAGVRKTVDASEQELAALRDGIRDMAKEIPAAATEIAGVAEAAGQLGIEVPNILSFTRTMIDLGEATNLSAEQAATSLARLANITQMPQTEFDRLGSTIVALGNNLATTEAEIVEMGLRLAGAGKQVGLTEAQILGLAGALSSVGIEAQAGGSAFSRVMVDMQLAVETGSERLEQFAQVAGMSASEFQRAFKEDAAGAIIAFIQGLATAEERGMSAIAVLDEMGITEIRLRDALLRAAGAGDLFNESIQIGTQAWEENTALTTEAEQRYGTTASQLELLRNKLEDAGIELGDKLTPILRDSIIPLVETLIGHISGLIDWFSSLDPKWQQVILTAIGFTAALGPLLLIIGKIITVVGTITGALPILGAAFTALTGPVGLVVAAIAAAIAIGVELYKNWDTIKEKLAEIWGSIKQTASDVWNGIWDIIKGVINWIIGGINKMINALNSIRIKVPAINIPLVGKVGGFEIGLPRIPTIPELAAGGIIQRSGLALVGEAGPELLELPQGAKVKPLTGESIDYDRLEAIAYASFYDAFVDALKTLGKGELRINIDGRTLAREMIPRIIAENQRLGVVIT